MDRRTSIRNLAIISAGAVFLPSCVPDEKKSSLSLKHIKIGGKDEAFLAELSEAILPKTATPGSKDLSAHAFALMMVDDCFSPENQDKFTKGLTGFHEFTEKKFDKAFIKCNPSEKMELLKSIEEKKDIPENTAFFYNSMKRLTIQAFTTSEYYLTKVQVYKLAPGKFYGCVPVNKTS